MADHRDNSSIDPGVHRVFADLSRVAVLETLRRSEEPMSVRELAEEVGLHANTVRSHLAILTEHGFAVGAPEERSRPGRPRVLYSAADVDSGDTRNYRLLAETLVAYLSEHSDDQAASAVAAGRGYGQRSVRGERPFPRTDASSAVDTVVRLLDEAGFRPRSRDGGTRIDLHHCPFRELAEANPDIVCGVHLGIMQGALAEMSAPVQAVRLRPFAENDRCITELRTDGDEAD
ncbi:helix-turn-helix transcriptional regulator [Nocardiopsis algeriensis]|uniref:helix-turn-helix transcriptional regulator n=1 Tax=Nocardiopsis algeriensis TaxID=1478215 RepID=UPI003B42BED4